MCVWKLYTSNIATGLIASQVGSARVDSSYVFTINNAPALTSTSIKAIKDAVIYSLPIIQRSTATITVA
jgi:hypothetical protein